MMDGNFITVIRTGAVGAIAAKYLARRSSETAAILGCGTQGRVQLAALKKVLSLKSVKCFDNLTERAEDFAVEMGSDECRVVVVSSPEDALREADVIVTTTPSEKWIVANEWITPGMHISAMGADTRGKQEIDPLLFSRARIVVDSLEQSQQLGEMQHVPEWIGNSCIYATLGEVVAGEKKGRFEENDITLFDATGIAFQDLVTAGLALERAVATKIGTWVKI